MSEAQDMPEVKAGALEFREIMEARGIYLGLAVVGSDESTLGFWGEENYMKLDKLITKDMVFPGQLSFLEFHCQTPGHAQELINQKFDPESISQVRDANPQVKIAAHAPFMEFFRADDGSVRFSFLFLRPPDLLKEEPVDRGKKLAQEIEATTFGPLIDSLGERGVSYLTVHVSSPGCSLGDDEFGELREKVGQLAQMAEAKGVTIGMETGGVTEGQVRELAEIGNVQITWDIEHAILDRLSLELFQDLLERDKIGLIHLAVPVEGEHTQGQLTQASDYQKSQIERVLRAVGKKNLGKKEGEEIIPVMLETWPTRDNLGLIEELTEPREPIEISV